MKSLPLNGFTLMLALIFSCTQAWAGEDPNWSILKSLQLKGDKGSIIRVKIFPHERDYKPHGIDTIKSRISVVADKPCALYRGSSKAPTSTGGILLRASQFQFSNVDLVEPRVLSCPAGFRLVREGVPAAQSYPYNGRLYLQLNANADIEAINLVNFSDYLRGVVPSEVYRGWPMESLKTQAVAARTYAVYHLGSARKNNEGRFWDVDDTINFQAYTGTSLLDPRTDEAVFSTDGQILTYQGEVIQAYYHAESGGQTEEALSVWSQSVPYTVARSEANDMELSKTVWERKIPLATLEQDLKTQGLFDEEKVLRDVLVPVAGRSPSGRVRYVTLIDQEGQSQLLPVSNLRRMIPQLPSQLFAFEKDRQEPGHLLIRGIGNGHGVGMSQVGAAALAGEKAWTYQQILEYYYIRTTLCTLQEQGSDRIPNCYIDSKRYVQNPVPAPPSAS